MAATYDFHTLSHLDFEELVRDLLQAHWKLKLESFGAGSDQGIDVRYLSGPHNIVIQAKHLLGSGWHGLRRATASECKKAIALAPTRYILATSVSLTPARKAEIIAAMPGVPLVAEDILGQEDINNLIRQHPQIERQHFKLWLSSTAVLQRILHSGVYNRTAAEMDIIRTMVPRFVHNHSVHDAESKLAETGALIIAGQPGVGKTTLARILVWLHAEQEWNIFVVDSLEEAFGLADASEKRLILLDDFLGQVRLSADHVRGVDARLPPLLSRVAAHENLRFILTTRDYILAQARSLSARLAPDRINTREYVLNVGRYTRAVKARILYNHLYFSALTPQQKEQVLAEDFFLKIIDHKNFNPRIIEEVTSQRYLALTDRPVRETIGAVLATPEILWELPYRQHISAEGRMMMLALFVNGRSAGIETLKASYVRVARALGLLLHPADVEASFRSTYRALEGSTLGLTFGQVSFTNPGLRDFVQSVVITDKLVPVLLPELETPSEVGELWDVFKTKRPSQAEQAQLVPAWISALDRVEAGGLGDRYDYIELAVDMCDDLKHAALEDRVNLAIDAFEQDAMTAEEVTRACALIEKSFSSSLPWQLEKRFRDVITAAAAALLHDYASVLNFEEMQSLDEALHTYGNNDALATEASHAAMECLARGIDSEIRDVETVEDLDEYEENVLAFMKKRNFSALGVVRDIDYRRDRLMEDGLVERRGSYSSGPGRSPDGEISADDIRSMFRELREG